MLRDGLQNSFDLREKNILILHDEGLYAVENNVGRGNTSSVRFFTEEEEVCCCFIEERKNTAAMTCNKPRKEKWLLAA